MHTAPGQFPEQPGIDCAKCKVALARFLPGPGHMIKDPFDFRRREVGIQYQSGLSLDFLDVPFGFEFVTEFRGAAILPNNGVVNRCPTKGSWMSGFALFAYAAAFAWAYVSLNTGMGALILFGSVQVTMIAAALFSGERLESAQWIGLAAAIGGLVYLVLPGISAPDPLGALLMCISGIAWGVYSIRGKGTLAPIAMTAGNFLRSIPMAIITFTLAFSVPIGSLKGSCSH